MSYVLPPANWIASYPKSGNTWVRMLLSAYKVGALDINAAGEATVFDCEDYFYNALAPRSINEMSADAALFLRPAVLMHLLASARSAPVLVKTHCANVVAAGITLVPRQLTKSAIYLVRDPRDVAVSYAKHTSSTIDRTINTLDEMTAVSVNENSNIQTWLTSWTNHVETWERDFVTRIRYEDLKSDPVDSFTTVLNTFGIKVNKQRVKKAVRLCHIDNMKKQEAKTKFVECGRQDKFFGQGKGWKEELTDKQARRIEEDHGEVMEKLGYKLEFL